VVVKACRKHIPLTELVLVAALCCSLAFAQEETAALTGQITDRDGLAVAGVKLQALNAGTNVSYLADTNETGFYNFPALPSGTYDVTATKDGFERAVTPVFASCQLLPLPTSFRVTTPVPRLGHCFYVQVTEISELPVSGLL
jgi:hypothetical protein